MADAEPHLRVGAVELVDRRLGERHCSGEEEGEGCDCGHEARTLHDGLLLSKPKPEGGRFSQHRRPADGTAAPDPSRRAGRPTTSERRRWMRPDRSRPPEPPHLTWL